MLKQEIGPSTSVQAVDVETARRAERTSVEGPECAGENGRNGTAEAGDRGAIPGGDGGSEVLRRAEKNAVPRLPAGPGAPGVAQSLQWFRDPLRFMERNRRRHGDVFTVHLGPLKRAAFIADPEAAWAVLTADQDLLQMGSTNRIFRPVLGSSSLFLLDGEEHRRHRRILMPPFQRGHVGRFAEMIAAVTELELRSWPIGERFELQDRMRELTLAVVTTIVFGDADSERRGRIRALVRDLLKQVQSPIAVLPMFQRELGGRSPFGRLMRTVGAIDELLFEEIRERRIVADLAERDDLLSLLSRAQPSDPEFMSDREIRDELITLLVSGHETTATALAWSFERLIRHPDVVERIRDELGEEEGEAYLEAVIAETLRQRPVLPVTARKLTAPIDLLDYTFPARWTLMPCVYLIHHDPAVFPEPERFRPERFLEGEPTQRVWLPFGAGVRHCIGSNLALMTLKIVLRTVLGAAELSAPSQAPEPIVRRNFTLAPGGGAAAVLLARDRVAVEPSLPAAR